MKKPFKISGVGEACVRVLCLPLIETFNPSVRFFVYKFGRICIFHRFVVRTEVKLSRASPNAECVIFLTRKEKCI